MTQLALAVETPLTFLPTCWRCGAVLDAIPVEEGESWHPAECWSHLAFVAHAKVCPRA